MLALSDRAAVMRDGKLVAVSLSQGGTEEGTVHVFDVATRKQLPDVIPRVNGGTAGGKGPERLFAGVKPTAQRAEVPAQPDLPLCWFPMEVDNSSGGQVWVNGSASGISTDQLSVIM